MQVNRLTMQKPSKLLRLCAAFAAVAILVLEYVGYKARLGINGYYFHDYSASLGASDVFWLVAATYLILLSVLGRWLFLR